MSSTSANDAISPVILSSGRTPSDVNDDLDVNVWAVVGDNLQLNYVDINILGPDLNVQVRQSFSDTNATPNYVVDANAMNAGTVDVNVHVFDIASNDAFTSFQFSVGDVTPPTRGGVH